jgi:DNA ligase-1
MEYFIKITFFIEKLNETNKTNEKKEILSEFDDEEIKKTLVYVYCPNTVFNVTSKNIVKMRHRKKYNNVDYNEYDTLFNLLDDLTERKITGDKALKSCCVFIEKYTDFEDIIFRIIDKNLKVRMNVNLINSVFNKLIDTFEPALANKFTEKDLSKGKKWFISRKLDGVRCLCHMDKKNNKVTFYSRVGKEFLTLKNIGEEIKMNILPQLDGNYFFDGEIVMMDEQNNENFKNIMIEIKKKGHQITTGNYCVFDLIKERDFYDKKSKQIYSGRLKSLHKLLKYKSRNFLIALEQTIYTTDSFEKLKDISAKNNWEGLMFRKDVGYKGKRSNDLLKYKLFSDEEYQVLDIITGPFRYISKETGLEEEKETMTAVIINYNDTKVVSGFSISDREMYYLNPELIIGKTITVQYFEKTEKSLRFPTFKINHGLKRDT